jgi:N-acyl-L-homoserine lactone synthetase
MQTDMHILRDLATMRLANKHHATMLPALVAALTTAAQRSPVFAVNISHILLQSESTSRGESSSITPMLLDAMFRCSTPRAVRLLLVVTSEKGERRVSMRA